MTRRTIEIDTLEQFDHHIEATQNLNGWFVQSIDLTRRGRVLRAVDPMGAVFLGCHLTDADASDLRGRGALLFPRLPHLPFNPYRPELYDAAELYGSGPYAESADAAIYAWSQTGPERQTVEHTLSAALHDHAITDGLDEAMEQTPADRVVGIMGGHAIRRGDRDFHRAAELAAHLTQSGRTVLTGGGPGAMEAANLGAYLSPWRDELDDAIRVLAEVPDFRPRMDAWVRQAFLVRDRWPAAEAGHSVGVPTWFYGHEPSNVFATEIAKYFTNALREDTLLQRCGGGIIYLPGAAGTVQEIFQAVTENYYAADDTQITPMILVDEDHWTQTLPAWPLLQQLGAGRGMGKAIHLVSSVEEAGALLVG